MADSFVPDQNFGDIRLNIIEEGGVRHIGPPPGFIGSKPSKEWELFIGKLPIDICETELIPLCEQFGKIYELRLIMKNIGESYAFIRYIKADDAMKALKHLEGFQLRPGVHLAVCKSSDNRRLFISGIPEGKSEEEIMGEISKYTDGVCEITLIDFFPDHAFISYNSAQAAILAKNSLTGQKLFNVKVKVKLANEEIEFNDDGTVQEIVADAGDSALAGTANFDQMPAVVVDVEGNPIICSECNYQKQENDHLQFIKARCGHAYCKTCSNYIFSSRNPEKPHVCRVCNEVISAFYNKRITAYVQVDD